MASLQERIKVFLWSMVHYPEYKYKSWKTRATKARLHIQTSEETLKTILERRCSVARYGDGELQMISHYLNNGDRNNFPVDTFQHYDAKLGQRLYEVLKAPSVDNMLVCLPHQLTHPKISDLYSELFWEREWLLRKDLLSASVLDRTMGDASFTRFYMGRKDILDYPSYISLLKELWQGRDILIVEGEFSRLGVGNDLFDNAISIRRVICPSKDAFAHYDEILSSVQAHSADAPLILLALGMTATVLAYDLAQLGKQAIDVGHVDVEYEWYRMGATSKVAIPNKYVNEVGSGRIDGVNYEDARYRSQIVSRVAIPQP